MTLRRAPSTVEKAVEGTRSAYDQIAETYVTVNSDMPEAVVRLAHKLTEHVRPGARVIDVGCGCGRDMGWFEAQGIHVVGVDLSLAMLDWARCVTTGSLMLADMRRLALRDASFEGAWCSASLLHLPKREAPGALGAIRRILKPGGMLMLGVQEGDCECWEGGYVEGGMRFFARYGRAEMEALLADAGFTVREIDVECTHRPWMSFVCTAD